ncbi:inosine-uridine nucleoside N-ribohydrolase [Novosphingobium sp. SG751A]|uniref:nucleoside hydrolase n=1 Tax=Novosphingobium sp. SG751A TaxID=2587000 RepID=UPI001552EC9B|nr:nucleoside hydrolase [Novosphingobium sp. SG751A]NOW45856.1 inosine-uridine nucleoside N-ribohydrolase [Novosphingobium sp. SG751A]
MKLWLALLGSASLAMGSLTMAAPPRAVSRPAEAASRNPDNRTLVWFDNDFLGPGQSNLQALIPLIRDPNVNLLGIGVVTGDQWLEEETQHALRFLEIAGRADVPVAKGAQTPLIRSLPEMKAWEARFGPIPWKGAWNAQRPGRQYHPEDPDLVPPMAEGAPSIKPVAQDAVHRLIDTVRAHPGQVKIICAGPLTNIALALRIAPDIAAKAKGITMQGGGYDMQAARVLDNADYATDFNFVFDPEAAHIVLTAPWKKITVVGNVTTSARMTRALADQIGASGTHTARYIAQYARIDQPLWDEMTVAVALDPTLVTKKFTARMDVDLMPGAGYGTAQMWKDELAPHRGEQIVEVVENIDVPRFLARFTAQARQ